MQRLMILMMTLSLTGCGVFPSSPAICEGTLEDRKAHAAALVEDGGPQSRRSGLRLLTRLKAGCAE